LFQWTSNVVPTWHVGSVQRRVWRYQRGNQILENEERQTTLWPKEKEQNRNHHHK
jgi:hypothetical protein